MDKVAALMLMAMALFLSSLIASAPASAIGGAVGGPPVQAAVAKPRPVRVAVLDSLASPTYVTGVLYNYWERVYEWLSADPLLDVMVLSNYMIMLGALDDFDIDVLVLIDNVPSSGIGDDVKSWWENGGAIVAIDSSIEYLCYSGILPAASEGSNGYTVYWAYDTSHTSVVEAEHAIVDGYSVGEELAVLYTGMAGYYRSALENEPEWDYITAVVHDESDENLLNVVAYEPPDKGRVAFIWYSVYDLTWDDIRYDAPFLPTLLRNAVKWAAGITDCLAVHAWVDNARPTEGDIIRAYVRVEDYAGRPIEDANVTIKVGAKSFKAVHQADGLYVADIDTSDMSGSVSATVRVEREGFGTKEVSLTFYVETPPPPPKEPSMMERITGDPLGLLALAGSILGLLGLVVGGIALRR